MSDKSGTSSQVIALPKGGGALQGISETFSPDLFTGTGNATVPLALPPGRNGFQPDLRLVYSTGHGQGPFGLGWDLSLPEVSRKTSKGIPRYHDEASDPTERDTFILSGAEDLVEITQSQQGIDQFRPRTEGLFARIEHVRKTTDDFWRVHSRDGLVSLYGTPASAGRDPAVVANPTDPSKVCSWRLSHTTDPFGNRIDYQYLRDRGTDGPHNWDQLYLQRIQYVDYTAGSETRFLLSVSFIYEERPDPFSNYRSGFEVRTRLRCRRIEIQTHSDAGLLVRTYELVYVDDRVRAGEVAPASLPRNGVSLLSQIKVVGHDGDETQELPPLEFGYTPFEPAGRRFHSFTATNNAMPTRSLANEDFDLVDLFGNGLPDIVQMNGSVQFWRNLGEGRFDRPQSMAEVPAGVHLHSPGVQFGDLNGDGRADLLVTDLGGYFPLSFEGRWSKQGFVRYQHVPSVDVLGSRDARLMDLDGDGVVDALRTGTQFELFFNDPSDGWSRVETRLRGPLAEFPDLSFSDPRVKLADMTGDGLQDFVFVNEGRIEYWPYLGHGRWGQRVTMGKSPVFEDTVLPPGEFDPKRVLLGDVDGDGLDDLVYLEPRRITVWINQSGNGWSDPLPIHQTPLFTDIDAVRLADMLGTGMVGVLWTADQITPTESTYSFLDLTGGVKPYVLDDMNNHMGATTRVKYAPSTACYRSDFAKLETRWKTPLPFPVQVVERVEVIDALSGGKLATEYHYHHGYWDGAEREFRGFGMVEQLDTQTFEQFNAPGLHGEGTEFSRVKKDHLSPPTLTRTWFHLGPIGDEFGERSEADFSVEYWLTDPAVLERPGSTSTLLRNLPQQPRADAVRALRGSILRTELFALDGTDREKRPYTVTESQYGIREETRPVGTEDERKRIFFPHLVAERTTQWERGNESMTQFTFTDDYDQYGQPRSHISIAVPRGRDFRVAVASSDSYLATQTVTTYAQRDDALRYMVDRVARTTTYEILNDGSPALFDLRETIRAGSVVRRVVGQTLNYYDGPAFEGLPFGQVGDHGALVRSETLVLTEDILRDAYGSARPPYLVSSDPDWTAEYPQEFRDRLPALAGYIFSDKDPRHEQGYFVTAVRHRYDVHDDPGGRGLLRAVRDPFGRDSIITYDAFDLLPVAVTDAVGLTTTAFYNYRVLQPTLVTEPNGNRTAFAFTPLGLLERTAVMGKEGEAVGDTPDAPGTHLVYDFRAFSERRDPVSVRTVRRVHHINEGDVPLLERDEIIETVEYSDGFGRLLQTRTQAEEVIFGDLIFGGAILPTDQHTPPGDAVGQTVADRVRPRVVVSGWQVYDNKGRVVEKYEPFFDLGWDYVPPTEVQFGQKATMFYDPRGQVIRTLNPDGCQQRVIYGVPITLDDLEQFRPTPWEAYTYDANDNAGRTHPNAALGYQNHWNTPASSLVDALGRTIQTVERNGADPSHRFTTHSNYDIRGNLLTVSDALGRPNVFQYVYDLANHPLRIENIDAGSRRMVLDALGNVIEGRDSKGALALHVYDVLNRPIRLWACDDINSSVTLRERMEYGDDGDLAQPAGVRESNRQANRLGRLHRHNDEAGLVTLDAYDFKGNLLEKARRGIADAAILSVFDPPPTDWRVQTFRVDWQPSSEGTLADRENALLDSIEYRTSLTYDALNRVKVLLYPEDQDNERKQLHQHYNRAGALERLELDGVTYVERIAYNAKGQRAMIAYGNGVMTCYAYDPRTFRLARLRTERFTQPDALTYHPAGAPLQDFAYEYDLVGDITSIHDRAPESGILNTMHGQDALDRKFTYDPLYRLLLATGRECDLPPLPPSWEDQLRCTDLTRARAYTEEYHYDKVGNLLQLRHAANGGSFTRDFTLVSNGNCLASMTIGQTIVNYTYDTNGNLIGEGDSRHFEWDHSDQMKTFRTQVGTSEPSVHAHYLYDAGGQRVKKLVRKQGGSFETTMYIDVFFEHHRWQNNGQPVRQNNHLHVMDDQQRIALVRVGVPRPDDRGPAVQFHLGDHLGSSHLVVNQDGSFINHEEYTPYGETSFGSFARKRYRFTGQERDEESGLHYHGARHYVPWIARWISCDPQGIVDGTNLYQFAQSNPIRFTDPTGTQSADSNGTRENPIIVHSLDNLPITSDVKKGALKGKEFWIKNDVTGITKHYRFQPHVSDTGGEFGDGSDDQSANSSDNPSSEGTSGSLNGNPGSNTELPSVEGGIQGGKGTSSTGSFHGTPGSQGWDKNGGVKGTKTDLLVHVLGLLQFSAGSDQGKSGGVPGGFCTSCSGAAWKQWLWLAVTAAMTIIPTEKITFSRMSHAAPRAVERAGFATEREARQALREFSSKVSKGHYSEVIVDAANPDRLIVPGFQNNTALVYRRMPSGNLELRTVLKLDASGIPGSARRYSRINVPSP